MIRLALRVSAGDAEIVLAELLELAPSGVEEVELDGGARVEYAIYGAPGELPQMPDLRAAVGSACVEIASREVPDDWAERWKRHHRPVLIASPAPGRVPDVWVRPPWEDAPTPTHARSSLEIVIDPGQAFGTGAHASTRLCLELLLALAADEPVATGASVLDVGTGSGILAIAAAKLGYRPVLGVDHDLQSVRAATQNAKANNAPIDLARVDLRTGPLPFPGPSPGPGRPPVVLANLLRPLLLDLAQALSAAPSHLLAGGLLREEVDEIADIYRERWGMHERERRDSGEWAAVWLQAGHRDA